jgi:hypothetical protein
MGRAPVQDRWSGEVGDFDVDVDGEKGGVDDVDDVNVCLRV